MLTPDDLQAMTPEQRLDALERMAEAHYGTPYVTKLCDDMGYTRGIMSKWRGKPASIPPAILYTLSAWTEDEEGRKERFRKQLAPIASGLEETATRLAALARSLAV